MNESYNTNPKDVVIVFPDEEEQQRDPEDVVIVLPDEEEQQRFILNSLNSKNTTPRLT